MEFTDAFYTNTQRWLANKGAFAFISNNVNVITLLSSVNIIPAKVILGNDDNIIPGTNRCSVLHDKENTKRSVNQFLVQLDIFTPCCNLCKSVSEEERYALSRLGNKLPNNYFCRYRNYKPFQEITSNNANFLITKSREETLQQLVLSMHSPTCKWLVLNAQALLLCGNSLQLSDSLVMQHYCAAIPASYSPKWMFSHSCASFVSNKSIINVNNIPLPVKPTNSHGKNRESLFLLPHGSSPSYLHNTYVKRVFELLRHSDECKLECFPYSMEYIGGNSNLRILKMLSSSRKREREWEQLYNNNNNINNKPQTFDDLVKSYHNNALEFLSWGEERLQTFSDHIIYNISLLIVLYGFELIADEERECKNTKLICPHTVCQDSEHTTDDANTHLLHNTLTQQESTIKERKAYEWNTNRTLPDMFKCRFCGATLRLEELFNRQELHEQYKSKNAEGMMYSNKTFTEMSTDKINFTNDSNSSSSIVTANENKYNKGVINRNDYSNINVNETTELEEQWTTHLSEELQQSVKENTPKENESKNNKCNSNRTYVYNISARRALNLHHRHCQWSQMFLHEVVQADKIIDNKQEESDDRQEEEEGDRIMDFDFCVKEADCYLPVSQSNKEINSEPTSLDNIHEMECEHVNTCTPNTTETDNNNYSNNSFEDGTNSKETDASLSYHTEFSSTQELESSQSSVQSSEITCDNSQPTTIIRFRFYFSEVRKLLLCWRLSRQYKSDQQHCKHQNEYNIQYQQSHIARLVKQMLYAIMQYSSTDESDKDDKINNNVKYLEEKVRLNLESNEKYTISNKETVKSNKEHEQLNSSCGAVWEVIRNNIFHTVMQSNKNDALLLENKREEEEHQVNKLIDKGLLLLASKNSNNNDNNNDELLSHINDVQMYTNHVNLLLSFRDKEPFARDEELAAGLYEEQLIVDMLQENELPKQASSEEWKNDGNMGVEKLVNNIFMHINDALCKDAEAHTQRIEEAKNTDKTLVLPSEISTQILPTSLESQDQTSNKSVLPTEMESMPSKLSHASTFNTSIKEHYPWPSTSELPSSTALSSSPFNNAVALAAATTTTSSLPTSSSSFPQMKLQNTNSPMKFGAETVSVLENRELQRETHNPQKQQQQQFYPSEMHNRLTSANNPTNRLPIFDDRSTQMYQNSQFTYETHSHQHHHHQQQHHHHQQQQQQQQPEPALFASPPLPTSSFKTITEVQPFVPFSPPPPPPQQQQQRQLPAMQWQSPSTMQSSQTAVFDRYGVNDNIQVNTYSSVLGSPFNNNSLLTDNNHQGILSSPVMLEGNSIFSNTITNNLSRTLRSNELATGSGGFDQYNEPSILYNGVFNSGGILSDAMYTSSSLNNNTTTNINTNNNIDTNTDNQFSSVFDKSNATELNANTTWGILEENNNITINNNGNGGGRSSSSSSSSTTLRPFSHNMTTMPSSSSQPLAPSTWNEPIRDRQPKHARGRGNVQGSAFTQYNNNRKNNNSTNSNFGNNVNNSNLVVNDERPRYNRGRGSANVGRRGYGGTSATANNVNQSNWTSNTTTRRNFTQQ